MMSESLLYPMKVVALKTGLSPHLIRVWERRYRAVTPGRSDTRRRLYSQSEVERLKLLQILTQAGHSIGRIAHLDDQALLSLVKSGEANAGDAAIDRLRGERQASGRHFVDRALAGIAKLDQVGLEAVLRESAMALGQQGVLLHVVAPLAEAVGDLWQDGTIGVAHEHFASATMRTFLSNMSRPFASSEGAPHLVVATPPGQLHELGALLVCAVATSLGWQTTYLGASLSAFEIAAAVRQKPARAVALSLVYPADDPQLEPELRRLRAMLPSEVALLVGGRAAGRYQNLFDELGIIQCGPLVDFMAQLQQLRAPAA